MNDFEKTKCLFQYSSLSESEKTKVEFYILDKYPFTLYVVHLKHLSVKISM